MFGLPLRESTYFCFKYNCYWGARAIYRGYTDGYFIDLLPDRKTFHGEHDVSAQLFFDWLDRRGLPWLRKKVKEIGLMTDSTEKLTFEEDNYKIEATPNASYGYLYIGAVQREKETEIRKFEKIAA